MNLNFLDFKNSENRQKLLIGIFVVVILVTILILYSFYFRQQTIPITQPETPGGVPSAIMTPSQKLNVEVLENPIFQSLKKFGKYPVEVNKEEVGRDNPFSPF